MSSMAIVGPTLDAARRDLQDATESLTTWWSRGSGIEQLDHRDQDVHVAVEALTRAVSSIALAVERLAELECQS